MRVPPLKDQLAASGVAGAEEPVTVALDDVLGRIPPESADLARIPAPLPTSEAFPEGRLSPRLLALLARALDVKRHHTVLLVGEPLVALAALLLALDEGPRNVVVATRATSRARWTARRLRLDDDPALTIIDRDEPLPRGPYARILDNGTGSEGLHDRLETDGVLVTIRWDAAKATFTSHVRAGDDGVDIDLTRHWVGPDGSKRERTRALHRSPNGSTIARLLSVERMHDNAWRGIAATPTEQGILRAVRETCVGHAEGPFGDEAEEDPKRLLARRLFHLGYLEQVAGTRQGAEALYRASLATAETAEGWTFYGWVRSQAGALQEAVDACRRAIHLDATFGNPYNDIGAYLMAEGKTDEAKTWFERATRAPRYAAPHYPYTNLGRVHLRQGDLHAAREAVEHALEMMPGYPPAERLLREIEAREAHDPMR